MPQKPIGQMEEMLNKMEAAAKRAEDAAERASKESAYQSCADPEGDAQKEMQQKQKTSVAPLSAENLRAHTKGSRSLSPQVKAAKAAET